MNVLDLISDENLLGPWFAGPSWDMWRSVLKAAHALPMTSDDLARFHIVAGDRAPPRRPVRILVAVAGRRAGKDSIISAVATAAAVGDYSAVLRPGEKASILALACDREQSRVLLNYSRAYFQRVSMLSALVRRETQDGFELIGDAEVIIATNDFRSIRGRSIALCVMDEAAFYSTDGMSTDRDVLEAIEPGLATVPGSMLAIISSPYRKAGVLYDLWAKHFGVDDDDVLVVRGSTRVFNSTVPQATIDAALARDPQAAASEWLAEWRADLSTFIDRQMVEAAIDRGMVVRPPVAGPTYRAFCDASSGRSDSFTAAIAHADGDQILVDAIFERVPPFNPGAVIGELAAWLREYRVSEIVGDKYAVGFTVEGFAREGIRYVESELDRSRIYLSFLPLVMAGRVRLLDHTRMAAQFTGLERRAFPSGLDKIQRPPSGHDDVCNSVAGSVWRVADDLHNGAGVWGRVAGGFDRLGTWAATGVLPPAPSPPLSPEQQKERAATDVARTAALKHGEDQATAAQAFATGCWHPDKLRRGDEPIVLMHFPRAVRFNDAGRIFHFAPGTHAVPERLADHSWLRSQGATLAPDADAVPAPAPTPTDSPAPKPAPLPMIVIF